MLTDYENNEDNRYFMIKENEYYFTVFIKNSKKYEKLFSILVLRLSFVMFYTIMSIWNVGYVIRLGENGNG